MSEDEVIAQMIMFFEAAYDTTKITLLHMIYYLCLNQECQDSVYEELRTLEDYSDQSLIKLQYLNAVIDETLRLAPAVLLITRVSNKDFNLAGLQF